MDKAIIIVIAVMLGILIYHEMRLDKLSKSITMFGADIARTITALVKKKLFKVKDLNVDLSDAIDVFAERAKESNDRKR